MEKQTSEQFKQCLLEEKARLENDLKELATRDDGTWTVKFPDYGTETAEQETNADEVEEFEADLTLGKQMERELKDADDALKKIEGGAYGLCEKCGKPIDEKRLEANPAARTHTKC